MKKLAFSFLLLFSLNACVPPPAQVAGTPAAQSRESRDALVSQIRPGLGTEWGETRDSRAREVEFRRAAPGTPLVSATLYYNDRAGIQALTGNADWLPLANPFELGSWASVSVEDGAGRRLPGLISNGQNYVVGEAGQRYEIVLKNYGKQRLEAVLSVDGLDVLDGKPAGYGKRGYIIEAGATLRVDGFRQSLSNVAAFRFGAVADSYAARKHGDTRNVGVIGVALFHEYGSQPFVQDKEIQQRQQADPFPGNREFATPP